MLLNRSSFFLRKQIRSFSYHQRPLIYPEGQTIRFKSGEAANKSESQTAAKSSEDIEFGNTIRATKIDKWLLLKFTKNYQTIKDVPNMPRIAELEKARSKGRIFGSFVMIFSTLAMCAVMVYKGKQDIKKGRTLETMNAEWHKKVDEEYIRKNAGNEAKSNS